MGPSDHEANLKLYGSGRVYRFPLAGGSNGEFVWSVFIIVDPIRQQFIDDPNQPGQSAISVEVFTVLLSEYEQFVEPFQTWKLN